MSLTVAVDKAAPGHLAGKRIKTYTLTDPAAGADFTITVPTGVVWKLLAVRAELTSDGNAATRSVVLELADGSNTFFDTGAAGTQAASLTYTYSWAPGVGTDVNAAGVPETTSLPSEVWLPEGYTLASVTASKQAGDQWARIVVQVEEHN